MLSFISSLFRFFSNGVTIGSKKETKNDSSKKNTIVGSRNSINETSIETQNNINNINISIGGFSKNTLTLSSNAKPSYSDLSKQAKSIMKQLVKSGHSGLVAELNGAIIEGLITKENQRITLDDIDSVEDDLNCLVANMYLTEPEKCSSGYGCMYDLTAKGKKFGKTLLEEQLAV